MAALWHRSPSTVATGRLTLDAMTRYVELASSEVVTRSSFGDSGPSSVGSTKTERTISARPIGSG
jgi:hypothetical protein